MKDVIEVSYTGDLLAHRRCPRSWAYEKLASFQPYEQVQAMEGRLVHHAMEWLTKFYAANSCHSTREQLGDQLAHYFRVLWARGLRTAFTSKQETLDRVLNNLYPTSGTLHPTVVAAVEGAQHTEYELRAVRKLVPLDHDGKRRLLLTGVLDVVVQQRQSFQYPRVWNWIDETTLSGKVGSEALIAKKGDVEIWDYKGSRAKTPYLRDYVLQLLTYAHLFNERSGQVPARCVLFFINEPRREAQLLAVPITGRILDAALEWTISRVKDLQSTIREFQANPESVCGGDPSSHEVREELSQQCTACGFRFDCAAYKKFLGGRAKHPDIDIYNILKN